MSTSGTSPSIYIYRIMEPAVGYNKLKLIAPTLINIIEIKDTGLPVWLIRESRQPGMLAVDYIIWDKDTNTWQENSVRLALTKIGWICANDLTNSDIQAALNTMTKVDQKLAEEHEKTLNATITTLTKKGKSSPMGFDIANRTNPLPEEQTQTRTYCSYYSIHAERKDSVTGKKIGVLNLTPGMNQAITCELSGKIFVDPVVLKRPISISNENQKPFQLRQGMSYEKTALLKYGIEENDFYENFKLKTVIKKINANNKIKLDEIQNEIVDAVDLEIYNNPVILPSTHSFSLWTIQDLISRKILTCPITRIPFTAENYVTNTNLRDFINELALYVKAFDVTQQLSSIQAEISFNINGTTTAVTSNTITTSAVTLTMTSNSLQSPNAPATDESSNKPSTLRRSLS